MCLFRTSFGDDGILMSGDVKIFTLPDFLFDEDGRFRMTLYNDVDDAIFLVVTNRDQGRSDESVVLVQTTRPTRLQTSDGQGRGSRRLLTPLNRPKGSTRSRRHVILTKGRPDINKMTIM